jgi:hypothetical protein
MAPVTASTKRESPKIERAGVEAGEKIFVELEAHAGDRASDTVTRKNIIASTHNARLRYDLAESTICIL